MAALRGVTSAVIDTLTGAWPELGAHRSLVEQVVIAEEDSSTGRMAGSVLTWGDMGEGAVRPPGSHSRENH
jgi:hypothetical protein